MLWSLNGQPPKEATVTPRAGEAKKEGMLPKLSTEAGLNLRGVAGGAGAQVLKQGDLVGSGT